MTVLGKVRPGAFTLALLVALSAVPRAARAQETPPPAGNAAPSVIAPGPAPGSDAPPAPPTAQPSSPPPGQPGYPPPGQPGYPPPSQPGYPPPSQPGYPPSGQEGYTPPGQGYPPGYAPPGYPPGYAPPGYPPGYAPPGYPPGYAPPGYPPGYASPRYGYPNQAYLPPPPPSHDGLYLRLHFGGGFTSISSSDGSGNSTKFSGGSVSLGLAVGGAIAPNLAIFGTAFGSLIGQPTMSTSGYTYSGLGLGGAGGDIGIGGFGAGAVYYFEPVNIYLSGVIAFVNVQADDANGDSTYTSKFGPGFQGMIGKEWWVSQHWGLGIAGEFLAATMKDKTTSNITWNAAGFNVLFSATCF